MLQHLFLHRSVMYFTPVSLNVVQLQDRTAHNVGSFQKYQTCKWKRLICDISCEETIKGCCNLGYFIPNFWKRKIWNNYKYHITEGQRDTAKLALEYKWLFK